MATFPHSPALPHVRRSVALTGSKHALRGIAQAVLVVMMALGSLALWAGSPLAWLWLASRVASSPNPGMGPYLLLFAGVIVTSLALARFLAGLDRAYRRLGDKPQRRVHHAFLRASGQEKLERSDSGPLGIVMTLSVIAALVALVAWVLHTGQPF